MSKIKNLNYCLLVLAIASTQLSANTQFFCEMHETVKRSCCCPHDHGDTDLDSDFNQTSSQSECCQVEVSVEYDFEHSLKIIEFETGKDPPNFSTRNFDLLFNPLVFRGLSTLSPYWLHRQKKSATYLVTARIRI